MRSSCKGEEELSRLRFLFPLLFQTFLYSSVPAPVAIHRPMPGSFVILAFPGRRRIVAQQPVHDRAGPVARAGKGSYMHWRVKRLCLPTSLYSGELCRKQVPGVNRRVGCFPRAQMHTANAKTLKCMTAKHHVVPLHRDAMVPRTGDREACKGAQLQTKPECVSLLCLPSHASIESSQPWTVADLCFRDAQSDNKPRETNCDLN